VCVCVCVCACVCVLLKKVNHQVKENAKTKLSLDGEHIKLIDIYIVGKKANIFSRLMSVI